VAGVKTVIIPQQRSISRPELDDPIIIGGRRKKLAA